MSELIRRNFGRDESQWPSRAWRLPLRLAREGAPNPIALWLFTAWNKKGTFRRLRPSNGRANHGPDKRCAWLKKLNEECPYQVVLPRRQLFDDSEIMDFLVRYAGKCDMYVEDDYAAFVRYCFEDPLERRNFSRAVRAERGSFQLAG